MLTRLLIRNFKRFEEADIELGSPVVFIGPNNSGKTAAIQALALWEIGLKRWLERKGGGTPRPNVGGQRSGVTINRRDLVAVPVPEARLLWTDLRYQRVRTVDGKAKRDPVRIEVTVEGVHNGVAWTCGVEFDYSNEESVRCRPIPDAKGSFDESHAVPDEARQVQVAYLPPMSGLAANETRIDPGAVAVRVGEGRTAEVLRNLCHTVQSQSNDDWRRIVGYVQSLFGVELQVPVYVPERGEITIAYLERGHEFDLSSAGRGLQQTLLLLAYMHAHKGSVLLLDEPDAHLEVLRQRQMYGLLTDEARASNCQIIAASHSEVWLNEAADRDVVVAFTGNPHRIDRRASQVLKSLTEIGFEHYQQAEQAGWVLYLEGSTDLALLQSLAQRIDHEAQRVLNRPYVQYVGNQPRQVRTHFHGLRDAFPDLRGVALFDRLPRRPELAPVETLMWKRREIENYVCSRTVLLRYAGATGLEASAGELPPDTAGQSGLFSSLEADRRAILMNRCIDELEAALRQLGKGSPWDADTKVSDDFLTPLFRNYFAELKLPNLMAKKSFYELARFLEPDEMDPEVVQKLDAIAALAAEVAGHGTA